MLALPKPARMELFLEELRRGACTDSLEGAVHRIVGALATAERGQVEPMRMPAVVNVACYHTRAHDVFVAHNGAILIRQIEGPVCADLPGASGDAVRAFAPWLSIA